MPAAHARQANANTRHACTCVAAKKHTRARSLIESPPGVLIGVLVVFMCWQLRVIRCWQLRRLFLLLICCGIQRGAVECSKTKTLNYLKYERAQT